MIGKKIYFIYYVIISLVIISFVHTVSAEQNYTTPFGLCAGTTRYNGTIEQAPYVCDANGKPVRTLGIGTSEPRGGLTLDQNFADTNANDVIGRHYDKSDCKFIMVNSTNYTDTANIKYTLCESKGQIQLNMYNNSSTAIISLVITPRGEVVTYKPIFQISAQGHWSYGVANETDHLMHIIVQDPHFSTCTSNC